MMTRKFSESSPSIAGDQPGGSTRPAAVAHVVPFVMWLLLMSVLSWVGPDHAWKYAARTGVCLLLFLVYRPWRWYPAPRLKHVPLAIAAGVLVYVIWVFPEIIWSEKVPWIQDVYLRFGIRPLGEAPLTQAFADTRNIYDPLTCGWPLSLIRLGGSAFVIAVIEEFFFRGFLYRWIIERDFTRVDLGRFDWEAFGLMILMFGIEHQRWLAGILAGIIYLFVMLKTRDIWAAALAHVITNFMLGVYVLKSGYYAFW